MESAESQWLKKHYRPALVDGPAAKKVKFSDIQKQLESEFPDKSFMAYVSEEKRELFQTASVRPPASPDRSTFWGLKKSLENCRAHLV